MTNNVICGFYDSGIGGLSLLIKAVKKLKGVTFIYLGDNSNAPYGNKSLSALKTFATQNIKSLISCNANVITVACNTLSSNFLQEFKTEFEGVIITGVLPPIVNATDCALISTKSTAESLYVKNNFKNCHVIPLPFLAGEIERFYFNKEKINITADLKGLPENLSTLILGCTHYLLIEKEIKKRLKNVNVISGVNTALNDVVLAVNKLKNDKKLKNEVTFDHFLKTPPQISKINGNTIFFVGEGCFYNKKVFDNLSKRLLN